MHITSVISSMRAMDSEIIPETTARQQGGPEKKVRRP
jgi:hypothetical protein